jgi:hypothetical protein
MRRRTPSAGGGTIGSPAAKIASSFAALHAVAADEAAEAVADDVDGLGARRAADGLDVGPEPAREPRVVQPRQVGEAREAPEAVPFEVAAETREVGRVAEEPVDEDDRDGTAGGAVERVAGDGPSGQGGDDVPERGDLAGQRAEE